MSRLCLVAVSAFAASVVIATNARVADACGGCLHPPNEISVVTDHRMAFSISTTQTVLWDQVRYSGDPREFAWVLPVARGTRIELSRDEWFAALEAIDIGASVPLVSVWGSNASDVWITSGGVAFFHRQ